MKDRAVASVSTELQSNYDSYYVNGTNQWRELSAKYKAGNIVSLCSSVPHKSVLEIGAGEGAVSAALSNRGFSSDITCLEISQTGIEAIRGRNIEGLTEAKLFDGYHVPFSDGHFDLAIASHVLEHVEHERLFLYEAMRVSKHLFIEVPLEDTLRLPLNFQSDSVGHINFYNRKTIRRLLQTCGLEVLEQQLYDMPLDAHIYSGLAKGTTKYLIRRAASIFGSRLSSGYFTYRCAVLCRRHV